MSGLRFACAVAVMSIACAPPPPAEPPPPGPQLIAILRHDGTVVPFATYANGTWQAPPKGLWALGEEPAPWFASIGLDHAAWFVQLVTGAPTASLHASAALKIDNHCQKNWGVSSDFPAQPASNAARHLPAGIAMTTRMPMSPFVDDVNQAPAGVREAALERFDRASRHLPGVRAIAVDRFRVLPAGPARAGWIYLEAKRPYAGASLGSECPREGFFKSWASTPQAAEESMEQTDCDRKGSYTSTPLAAVTLDGRTFAITFDHGYEDERYSIIQLAPEFTRVLSVEGGGC
jgi:hypothetical protein